MRSSIRVAHVPARFSRAVWAFACRKCSLSPLDTSMPLFVSRGKTVKSPPLRLNVPNSPRVAFNSYVQPLTRALQSANPPPSLPPSVAALVRLFPLRSRDHHRVSLSPIITVITVRPRVSLADSKRDESSVARQSLASNPHRRRFREASRKIPGGGADSPSDNRRRREGRFSASSSGRTEPVLRWAT